MIISNDIFQCIDVDVNDELLAASKIAAYMYNQEFTDSLGKEKPFTPKSFPGKAILIKIPFNGNSIEIYLDSNDCVWDSKAMVDGKLCKLSPDQMQKFFDSQFYSRMMKSLAQKWPVSDPLYCKLFNAVAEKQLRVGVIPEDELSEAGSINEIEHSHEVNQPHKRKDLANTDVDKDGKRDYAGSGRKIVSFNDNGIKRSSCTYFCWPRKGKEFKWNTWKEWTKLKPFCKMTFEHNGREYMISMSLFDENFDNRGFRGADTVWKPPYAWLTPEECQEVMRLSVVRKFLRQCLKKIKPYLEMTSEEILKKIDKPERVSIQEIDKTKRVIRHATKVAFGKGQADNYKYKR